jgi:hypothetical protein
MSINKKALGAVLVAAVLAGSGFVYTALAGNRRNARNEALKKTEAYDSSKEEKKTEGNAPAVQDASSVSTGENQPGAVNQIDASSVSSKYPIHKNISTTYFWVGEEAGKDNKNISNCPSAWDEDWLKHFGGVDDPNKRNGYFPAKFTPKENPFYFALPYNDFDENGNRKSNIYKLANWRNGKKCGPEESACKNQWIKITKDGKSAYAQWEDVGPFKENDEKYVFGTASPASKTNSSAGLDVSPAVRDYLKLSDIDKTDWQFIDASQVPDGPWKKIITTSQVYWK